MNVFWNKKHGAAAVYVLSPRENLTSDVAEHVELRKKTPAGKRTPLPEFFHHRDELALIGTNVDLTTLEVDPRASVFAVNGNEIRVKDDGTLGDLPPSIDFEGAKAGPSPAEIDAKVDAAVNAKMAAVIDQAIARALMSAGVGASAAKTAASSDTDTKKKT